MYTKLLSEMIDREEEGFFGLHNQEISKLSPSVSNAEVPSFQGNRVVPLYTEVFQGVGIEEFHCVHRCIEIPL